MGNLIRFDLFIFKSYFIPNIIKYNCEGLLFWFAGGREMKLITLYLPEPYIHALDRLVNERYYPNRAEAIRVAIRDLLTVEAWGRKSNG